MNKKLTEELIHKRLKAKGIDIPNEITYLEQYEKVLKIYDSEITHEWTDRCEIFFYEESTADGYGIYIATEEDGNPNINEDVYYYESDWFEKLGEYITNGCFIYIERGYEENYGMQETVESVYEAWYVKEFGEVEDELLDEGYEYPKPE